MNIEATFSKQKKLKSLISINKLFDCGKSFTIFPFKVVVDVLPYQDSPFKFLVSVPKRNIKLAVNRNKIKRQVREAIRLNQHNFNRNEACTYHIGLIYLNKKVTESEYISRKLLKVIERFNSNYSK